MGADVLQTGTVVNEHGIYQSACACRTAIMLAEGERTPTCLSCGQETVWRLAQPISTVPGRKGRRTASGTVLKSSLPPPRQRIDSASGD
jgi:hypothetical protein